MKTLSILLILFAQTTSFAANKKFKTCKASASAKDYSSYSSGGAESECRSEAKMKAMDKCSRLDSIESSRTSVTYKKYVTWGSGHYKVKCSAVVRGYYYKN